MKKQIIFFSLFSLLIVTSLIGCTNKQDITSSKDSDWQEEIQLLNQQYKAKCLPIGNTAKVPYRKQADDSNDQEQEDKKDTQELKEESNEVMYYDLLGFQQGAIIGSTIGGFWGALIGGTAAGATLSIVAYVNQGDEVQMYDPNDLSWGCPNTRGKFTDIDRRDPITTWSDYKEPAINNAIGMNAGLIHNYVISELLNDKWTIENTDWSDQFAILENVLEILPTSIIPKYASIDMDEMRNGLYKVLDNINLDDIEFVQDNINDRLVNLEEFCEIAINLDSALMWEYADKYSTIIEYAYEHGGISEEDAMFVNGSISVFCYSRMLWINYMPMPEQSSLRVAFNTTENKVTFCEKDYLPILMESEDIAFWGIPHFVHGNLAEVYFHEEELFDYLGCTLEEYFAKNSTYLQEEPYITTLVEYLWYSHYDVCGIWGCREIIEVPNTHNLVYYTKSYPY